MAENWLRDQNLGEELRRLIENYEVETGREVHAINLEREPITSVGKPRKRTRILEVLAVVKRPAD